MATTEAIAACGRTIVSLLRAGLASVPVAEERVVLAGPADLTAFSKETDRGPGVTVFLYHVDESRCLRIQEAQQVGGGTTTPPQLLLRLSYLITAWAKLAEDEHKVLGAVLRTLDDHPLISLSELQDRTTSEVGDRVEVVLDSLTMESHARLWGALGLPLRPSLAYRAMGARI